MVAVNYVELDNCSFQNFWCLFCSFSEKKGHLSVMGNNWMSVHWLKNILTYCMFIPVSGSWADRSPLHEAACQGRLLALKTLLSQVYKHIHTIMEQKLF